MRAQIEATEIDCMQRLDSRRPAARIWMPAVEWPFPARSEHLPNQMREFGVDDQITALISLVN